MEQHSYILPAISVSTMVSFLLHFSHSRPSFR